MFKVLPLDVVIDPTEQMSRYVAEHSVAFVLLGVAVVAAIVLIVRLFKQSRKKG
jgi:hypothetical protein